MPLTQSQRSVLFVAGDLSGDRHMERLVRKYADKHPGDRLLALGGQALGLAVQERGGHMDRRHHRMQCNRAVLGGKNLCMGPMAVLQNEESCEKASGGCRGSL